MERHIDIDRDSEQNGRPAVHVAIAAWVLVTIGIGLAVVAAFMLAVNLIS